MYKETIVPITDQIWSDNKKLEGMTVSESEVEIVEDGSFDVLTVENFSSMKKDSFQGLAKAISLVVKCSLTTVISFEGKVLVSGIEEDDIERVSLAIRTEDTRMTAEIKARECISSHDLDNFLSEVFQCSLVLDPSLVDGTFSSCASDVIGKLAFNQLQVLKINGEFTMTSEQIRDIPTSFNRDKGPMFGVVVDAIKACFLPYEESFSDIFYCEQNGLYETILSEDIEEVSVESGIEYKEAVDLFGRWYADKMGELITEMVQSVIPYSSPILLVAIRIVSPREYNFRTDSFDFLSSDQSLIYLATRLLYKEEFEQYIVESTTNRDGFISFYNAENFNCEFDKWEPAQVSMMMDFVMKKMDKENYQDYDFISEAYQYMD